MLINKIDKFKIMKQFLLLFTILALPLGAADFSVSSFNCGSLPYHLCYIRAVCMQKLMQERYNTEPHPLIQLEKIEQLALTLLFSTDVSERQAAQEEWHNGDYSVV